MTTYYNYLGQAMPLSAPYTRYVLDNGGPDGGYQDHVTLTAGDGNVSVDSNGGIYDTLIGGNGDDTFYVANITDVVQVAAGLTGVKSVTAWDGGYTLPDNVQNLTFFGAGNWGAGNTGANLIVMGGNDHASLDGGGGNDVLVGGAGSGENDFQFEVGLGGGEPSHDVFYNFHPEQDTVRIVGADFTTFAQIQGAMTEQTGPDGHTDTVLTIDSNDSITFRDMTIAQFQPRDFMMPVDFSKLGPLTFDDEFTSLKLYDPSSETGNWQTTFGSDPTKVDDYAITSNQEEELYVHPGMVGDDGVQDLSAYDPFSINQGGGLTISAQKFSYADSQHTWGQSFASGMLNSRGVFMQQYGYFDMRAELPTTLGSWPAFWLSQDPYKPGVEADVLEHLAMYPDAAMSRSNDAGAVTGHTAYIPALSGFHDYGMLWTPTTTTFYIDSIAVMAVQTPASWDQPMYMLLNLAFGGWGGTVDEQNLPSQMQVQYVRVYGLADTPVNVSEGYATYTAVSGVNSVTLLGAGQTVNANNAGDTLTSNDQGGNHLIGGTGNDTITLGGGGDTATGGGGTDTFLFNAVPTSGGVITDFNSSDTLDLSGLLTSLSYSGSNAVADGVIAFSDDGSGDAQVLADVNGTWTLVTTLDGVAASSLGMIGGVASETNTGNGSTVSTTAASYTAAAGVTNIILIGSHQTVTANNAGDTIHSNNTANTLNGGTGNDTFFLGGGGDTVTGGGGSDTFMVGGMPTTASVITDFGAGDQINLSGLLTSLHYSGPNAATDHVIDIGGDGQGTVTVDANVNGTWTVVTTLDNAGTATFSLQNGVLTELANGALNVTSSSPVTVAAGQAIFTAHSDFVTFTQASGGLFVNNGLISAPAQSFQGVFALAAPQGNTPNNADVFQNNGQVSVAATQATAIWGITLQNNGALAVTGGTVRAANSDTVNTGTITVTSSATGSGVADDNAGGLVQNQASGMINVSASGAIGVGVQMAKGGEVDNAGTIQVSGPTSPPSNSGYTGVYILDQGADGHNAAYSVVKNTGSITVNSSDGFGVYFNVTAASGAIETVPAGQFNVVNSGTITATYAISFDAQGGVAAAIQNSGTLNGHVDLTGLGDRLVNSGTINGPIYLSPDSATGTGHSNTITNTGAINGAIYLSANGDDTYDGRGGTQTGGIHLFSGADTVYLGNDGESVFGGTGAATIVGGTGNDTLAAGFGADTFVVQSNGGADVITGFKVASDVIDLSGISQFTTLADVLAAATQQGANTVIQLGGGSQVTLDNISVGSLTVADFSYAAAPPPSGGSGSGSGADPSGGEIGGGGGIAHTGPTTVAADFNGDGMGDMFWQNTVNGLTSAWELNGSGTTGISLPNAAGWQVMDTGNFEGGATSGDMLLRNSTTGMVDIWTDNAGQLTPHDVTSATLDWQIMGTADFNGDGISDILWRNEQNGYVSVWQMNGTSVATTYNPGVVGLQWHVIGAGDYVGDGKAEVLWRDSGSGEVNLWTIDGPGAGQTHGQTVAFLPLEWTAVGQGDFNGDGRQDVLWHDNSTGQVAIWEMNGAQVLASQTVANLGAQWKVVDVVDANGDGKADIVWRDSGTGQAVLWDMNGFNVIHTAVLGTVDNTWQPINHHYDWI